MAKHAIPLIFRFWIYVTTVLVNSGYSAHLLKALPRVCSGQQVDSSCVVQSHLLATSADEPSIGKELVELIAIISKLPTTNHSQNSDSSPTAQGVADGISSDVADDSDDDGEDESDYNSDLDNASRSHLPLSLHVPVFHNTAPGTQCPHTPLKSAPWTPRVVRYLFTTETRQSHPCHQRSDRSSLYGE